jgi:hypothetical protein
MTDMDELSQGESSQVAVPQSAKLMLRVVYIMGIVLVLLFMALIGGIIWKATHKVEVRASSPALVELGLAPGTSVLSMDLDGDRVAINTGPEIIIVDIRKNAVVSRIATISK